MILAKMHNGITKALHKLQQRMNDLCMTHGSIFLSFFFFVSHLYIPKKHNQQMKRAVMLVEISRDMPTVLHGYIICDAVRDSVGNRLVTDL